MHASTVFDCESQRNIHDMNNGGILLAGCMTNPPFYARDEEVI